MIASKPKLWVLKKQLREYLLFTPTITLPVAYGIQRIILAIDCVFNNPNEQELTNKWLSDELKSFVAAHGQC